MAVNGQPTHDPEQITRFLIAIRGADSTKRGFTEIRAIGSGDNDKTLWSGVFDLTDFAPLLRAVASIASQAHNIYTTLNAVHPDLFFRSKNHLKRPPRYTTTDDDIVRRLGLYLDIDAIRKAGISSTDEQHALAIERARKVAAGVSELGFCRGLLVDSGGGANVYFRLPEMTLDDADALVAAVTVTHWADRTFSDDAVKVDVKTANRSRIVKLPGTFARKGDNDPRRPHRMSQILDFFGENA